MGKEGFKVASAAATANAGATPQGWIAFLRSFLPSFLPIAGNLRHHGAAEQQGAQQRRFITFAIERRDDRD